MQPLAAKVNPARYRVLAMTLGEGMTIRSEYEIELQPLRPDARTVQTNYSAGVIDRGGEEIRFDSRNPSDEDPWPMLIQHVVASTPLRVVFEHSGKPVAVEGIEEWKSLVTTRLGALEFPVNTQDPDSELLDPEAILRDLSRTFPGAPVSEGPFQRPLRVAGVAGSVDEDCRQAATPRGVAWECEGGVESLQHGAVHVFGITTHLAMGYDRSGLYRLEADYVGTVVRMNPSTGELLDEPIGGKRLVERL